MGERGQAGRHFPVQPKKPWVGSLSWGTQVCGECTSGSGRSPWCLHFFVPLNQALAPRVSRPVLVCCKHILASWWGLLWLKNELIWGCNGLWFSNTKIDLFPLHFYSTDNGITGLSFFLFPATMMPSIPSWGHLYLKAGRYEFYHCR